VPQPHFLSLPVSVVRALLKWSNLLGVVDGQWGRIFHE
jgi:hypothetical protein